MITTFTKDTSVIGTKLLKKKLNVIVLSDIHLGSSSCRSEDILDFLKKNTAKTIILNGDIIDFLSLQRGSKLKKNHGKIIRILLKLADKKNKKVILLRGNHDEFLKDLLPYCIGNIKIKENYILNTDKKYFIFHGDVLDVFITKAKLLAKIGSIGYDFALLLNRIYNNYRKLRNLPYYSISKDIKNGVKKATNFINDFEENAIKLVKNNHCDVAICGHIHHPKIEENYMNSGDLCENCTALVQDFNNKLQIIEHHKTNNL